MHAVKVLFLFRGPGHAPDGEQLHVTCAPVGELHHAAGAGGLEVGGSLGVSDQQVHQRPAVGHDQSVPAAGDPVVGPGHAGQERARRASDTPRRKRRDTAGRA